MAVSARIPPASGRDHEVQGDHSVGMIDPAAGGLPRLAGIGALEDARAGGAGVQDREIPGVGDERVEPDGVSPVRRLGLGCAAVVVRISSGPAGHIESFRSRAVDEEGRNSWISPVMTLQLLPASALL